MPTLSASLKAAITAAYQGSPDVGTLKQDLNFTAAASLANGTGANQANALWVDTRTLSASATENLDLAGVLVDAFGNTLTFTKVKAILVEAADANVNDVVIGGAASNAWAAMFGDATDTIKVRPGGFFMLVAPNVDGLAVTAGSGDILKVANSAGSTSVTYTIVIIGVA